MIIIPKTKKYLNFKLFVQLDFMTNTVHTGKLLYINFEVVDLSPWVRVG